MQVHLTRTRQNVPCLMTSYIFGQQPAGISCRKRIILPPLQCLKYTLVVQKVPKIRIDRHHFNPRY